MTPKVSMVCGQNGRAAGQPICAWRLCWPDDCRGPSRDESRDVMFFVDNGPSLYAGRRRKYRALLGRRCRTALLQRMGRIAGTQQPPGVVVTSDSNCTCLPMAGRARSARRSPAGSPWCVATWRALGIYALDALDSASRQLRSASVVGEHYDQRPARCKVRAAALQKGYATSVPFWGWMNFLRRTSLLWRAPAKVQRFLSQPIPRWRGICRSSGQTTCPLNETIRGCKDDCQWKLRPFCPTVGRFTWSAPLTDSGQRRFRPMRTPPGLFRFSSRWTLPCVAERVDVADTLQGQCCQRRRNDFRRPCRRGYAARGKRRALGSLSGIRTLIPRDPSRVPCAASSMERTAGKSSYLIIGGVAFVEIQPDVWIYGVCPTPLFATGSGRRKRPASQTTRRRRGAQKQNRFRCGLGAV